MNPLAQLLDRMTATPNLDRLERFAQNWREVEAEEQAKAERAWEAQADAAAEARRRDREDLDGAEA